jgi:hypothetical protein
MPNGMSSLVAALVEAAMQDARVVMLGRGVPIVTSSP